MAGGPGEHLTGRDNCKVEKFEGAPGKLKKVGESSSNSPKGNSNFLKQPFFDDITPSFQPKVKI